MVFPILRPQNKHQFIPLLKQLLNELVYPSPNLSLNEIFDEKTVNAVKLFKSQYNFRIRNSINTLDGEATPALWGMIGQALGEQRLRKEFIKYGNDYEFRRLFAQMQSSSNLEITGNIVDRETAMKRIKGVVGAKAEGLLYLTSRDNRYFVDYKGKDHDSLARTGLIGVVMADIIDNPNVVTEFRVITTSSVVAKDGDIRYLSQNGGAVTIPIAEDNIQIFICYDAINMANIVGLKDADGNPLKFNNEIIDAHEFGHAWGLQKDNMLREAKKYSKEWGEWVSGVFGIWNGTKVSAIIEQNNKTSLIVENYVRDRFGFPHRVKHSK